MTVALMGGGAELHGWGVDRALSAALYDAVNLNTRATGQWAKGKAPTFDTWPRPERPKPAQAKKPAGKVTVAQLWARFNAHKNGG